MDTTAEDIVFDDNGYCNYCSALIQLLAAQSSRSRESSLDDFVARVKRDGRDKEYDCVIGLSGGADSAYTLYLAKEKGLRPIAVHMDNGWNSELAVHNIKNLVRKLDVDLHTHVIDWEEYKILMQAFFDANVIDVDLLYDNAMFAVNYRVARTYGLKWILAGTNTATEGMKIPDNWRWFKFDKLNIKNIAAQFGRRRLETFPAIGTLEYIRYRFAHKISWVSFLDYIDYHKSSSMKELVDKFEYKPYPYKHYESVFTRFYQGYILPQKFNVDKRKVHLSTLICSNQMTRNEALEIISHIPYPDSQELESDKLYFIKKMGWDMKQLDKYIAQPGVPHSRYGSEKRLWDICELLFKFYSNKKR